MKRLFEYVEIKTKITSVFAFAMTLSYLFVSGMRIDLLRSFVFFCGMFLFDLTATTINNYCDTKKNSQALPFARRKAFFITLLLLMLSIASGLYLVYLSDAVVLLAGGLCFLFGILYSFGPVPLSHGPYGEVASGFFYGFMIPFLLIYLNDPASLLTYSVGMEKISIELNAVAALKLLLLSVLPFCLTANIMFANNLCDSERDKAVGRFTLAYYLERKCALKLFALLYYAAYASVVLMVLLGFLPPLCLLLLLTLFPVQKNISAFFKKQDKAETFVVSIQNFIIIFSGHIALMLLGALLPGWGNA